MLVPWMSGLVSGLQTVYGSSNLPGTSIIKSRNYFYKVFRFFFVIGNFSQFYY